MTQEDVLERLLGSLLKTDFPLIWNVLKLLAKYVLVPLRVTAAPSATDSAIQKRMFGSGTTKPGFSNEDLNNIMKIVKTLEHVGLLIKGVSDTVENEVKEQIGGHVGMLVATLGASLLFHW